MKRLLFGLLALLTSILLPPELAAQGKVWHIGLFHVGLDHIPVSLPTLREGLKVLGYEEGKNIRLDWRNLPDEEAARETAKEFVRNRVDLIVAFEDQTVRAVKLATSDIPVVFLHVSDPVASGYVTSLARPGGNLTGFVSFLDVTAKRLELFKEVVPRLRRVLVLIDPEDPITPRELGKARTAAASLKLQLVEREVSSPSDVDRVSSSLKRGDVDGIFVVSPSLQTKFFSLFVRLASEKRLPLAGHRKEWVEQGALFSYSPDLAEVGRAAAPYVDQILKGAKPGDLPVQQVSRLALVINLKTARTLGLTVSREMLLRADQIIQ